MNTFPDAPCTLPCASDDCGGGSGLVDQARATPVFLSNRFVTTEKEWRKAILHTLHNAI